MQLHTHIPITYTHNHIPNTYTHINTNTLTVNPSKVKHASRLALTRQSNAIHCHTIALTLPAQHILCRCVCVCVCVMYARTSGWVGLGMCIAYTNTCIAYVMHTYTYIQPCNWVHILHTSHTPPTHLLHTTHTSHKTATNNTPHKQPPPPLPVHPPNVAVQIFDG